MYANSYFESGSNLMVSKWRMKIVFQLGAHDAVGGADERLDEARLHVVDINNCLPSGRLEYTAIISSILEGRRAA